MKILGWRPPQRPQWIQEITKIPGPIRIQLSLLTILTISSVSSTVLQITQTTDNTSGVNISGSLELQEAKREK